MKIARRFLPIMASIAAMAMLGGCGDKIVYRDVNQFPEPLPGAAGFLGYSNVEAKRTVCGNCHVGKQAHWSQTKHANAWSTLQASTAAAAVCEGCHSTNARGNISTEASSGWVATQNARYQDVQCESCHGPGLTHVSNPDVFNTKPLAPLQAGLDLPRGCGQCHSGAHQPFAEEWAGSRHARVVASRATNASCVGCHEAKGVLQAWGVRSTFLEQSGTTEHMAITCAVCHDPHEKRNPAQLRFSISVASVEHNLCMKCHYRRAVPDTTNSSPHSPQGPVLLGEAGWIPPNFTYPAGSLVGSHGSDNNERLCASCHVNSYTVTDKVTGAFSFRATGHSFQATPCVDADGIPTGTNTCTSLTEKSFKACTTCHLSETAARTALITAKMRLDALADQVESLLTKVPSSETKVDSRISTAEGARFNMRLARERGSPAHNPFLIEALLLASIKQIEIDYGVKVTGSISLEPQLAQR